jgi:hypothetical protein
LNWYITQWDLFLESKEIILISYKKTTEESYKIYREITQLIDIIAMDYYSICFSPRYIVASTIFLSLCLNLLDSDINGEIIVQTLYADKQFVNLFKEFLKESMNLEYEDILPAIQYCSKYINLKFTYDLPLSVQINPGIDEVNKINPGNI